MPCKERLEAYLRENQIPFQVQHHPRVFTAQKIAESEHIQGKNVAKTMIARADNRYIMLVLPASNRVDLSQARKAVGAIDLHQAHESEFASLFPDCEVGTMPPFGNLYGLPVYVEKHLTEVETMVFPAGTASETMSIRYADFERLVHPKVITFAQSAIRA